MGGGRNFFILFMDLEKKKQHIFHYYNKSLDTNGNSYLTTYTKIIRNNA